MSPRAVAAIKNRRTKVQSWFLDLSLVMGYWAGDGSRTYHHTAPVNALYGLHEGLVMLREEGLEASWRRHARMSRALVAGIEAMGLAMRVGADVRLPELNVVNAPEGVNEAAVRKDLLALYDLEIGGALGAWAGKAWRIGLMGQSATPRHVLSCIAALESALIAAGADIPPGAGSAAARAVLQGV
jgi:alanine-glyoxylate transaminase/serine-glyoxylate transaminase/serine-pyruvate transaminase